MLGASDHLIQVSTTRRNKGSRWLVSPEGKLMRKQHKDNKDPWGQEKEKKAHLFWCPGCHSASPFQALPRLAWHFSRSLSGLPPSLVVGASRSSCASYATRAFCPGFAVCRRLLGPKIEDETRSPRTYEIGRAHV